MIEMRRADELSEGCRRKVATCSCADSPTTFAYFSTDPQTLAGAFAHMVLPERFVVALVDGTPAAIASLTEGDEECFEPERRTFQRHLGRWHGLTSFLIVRSQFLGAHDDSRPGLAEIGFVTTAPSFQGKGVATALLGHLLRLPFAEFVLRDIKDTNAPAVGLHRKLGFVESQARPVRFARRAGFRSYVTMTLRRTDTG